MVAFNGTYLPEGGYYGTDPIEVYNGSGVKYSIAQELIPYKCIVVPETPVEEVPTNFTVINITTC